MYMELLKKSFQQQFVYRTNTFIYLLTTFIYLFVTVSIWSALFKRKGIVDGISLNEMFTYILMVHFVRSFVMLSVSKYVSARVSSGIISIDFIRPVSLKLCAIFDSLGSAVYHVMMFAVPMVILGGMLWGFVLPTQSYQWLLFVPSLFMAMILYSTIDYIMGLTAFWTKTSFHVSWIVGSFMTLFSGSHIPLWFYPEPIRTMAIFLPFRYCIFEPINIFLGKVTFHGALVIILVQFIWLMILLTAERIVWSHAQRVVTIQGG